MNENKDVSVIEWHPLPAPADRYVLIRYEDEHGLGSEMAYSLDGRTFIEEPVVIDLATVRAWAYLPYDVPGGSRERADEEAFEALVHELNPKS